MTTVIKSQILILNWKQFLKTLGLNRPLVETEADRQNIIMKIHFSSTCCHRPDRRWQRDGYRRLDIRYDILTLNIKLPLTLQDQKLHNEGLPDGWSMQTMDSGRVLFVNAMTGEHTLTDPRTGKECYTFKRRRGPFFSSPPSPLSLMDVLTVGATAER